MGPSIDARLLSRWMLHKQRLHPRSSEDGIIRVVDDIVALHATDSLSPYLSLLARLPGFEKPALDDLLEKEMRLGKVRFVRKTIHVLTLPMLPVTFAAVSESNAAQFIDAAAVAVFAGMGVEDLGWFDSAYAPPFAPVWNALISAALKSSKA